MGLKEAYQERIEAQLKEWDADFTKWKARAEIANAEAKIEYYKKLEGVQPKIDQAKAKLTQLKTASGAAWEDMKTGIDRVSDDLSTTFADLRRTFDQAISNFQTK